jgi:hypothetical protein
MLQAQLVRAFLEKRRSASLVGQVGIAIKAATDLLGLSHPKSLRLFNAYYLALDDKLTGTLRAHGLDMNEHPVWMRDVSAPTRNGIRYVPSPESSPIEHLRAGLQRLDSRAALGGGRHPTRLDSDLLLAGRERYTTAWKRERQQVCERELQGGSRQSPYSVHALCLLNLPRVCESELGGRRFETLAVLNALPTRILTCHTYCHSALLEADE